LQGFGSNGADAWTPYEPCLVRACLHKGEEEKRRQRRLARKSARKEEKPMRFPQRTA